MNKDIMDVRKVAEYLNFSEKKIRNLVRDNSIPYSKIGGQYRFIKQEIDGWLKGKGGKQDKTQDVLEEVKNTKNPLEKRLLFLGLLTAALEKYKIKPILVGGNALEFYTMGGYATADIDIVFPDNKLIDDVLKKWNFEKEGRHWFRADLDIAIEAPGSSFDGDRDKVSEVKIKGFKVYIIGIEDLIIDRLNAYVHWKSNQDGFWAKELMILHKDKIDWKYLLKRSKSKENNVEAAFVKIKKEAEDAQI